MKENIPLKKTSRRSMLQFCDSNLTLKQNRNIETLYGIGKMLAEFTMSLLSKSDNNVQLHRCSQNYRNSFLDLT